MAERQIPGGPFLNETATAQRQVPGGPFVNETVSTGSSTPTLSAPGMTGITPTGGYPQVTLTF